MRLANFEEMFDDVILKRGYQYYQDGKVDNLDEVEANHFLSIISGTDLYMVYIELDSNNDVINYLKCDCPYDGGYCKHQAAVLYELEERFVGSLETVKHKPRVNKPTLYELLPNLDKHQLVDLLLQISSEHEDIEKKLLFQLTPSENEVESSKQLIMEYINQAKDQGFIKWNRVHDALKGADLTLDKAYEKAHQNQEESAVYLSLTVLPIVVDMLQYADDSSGEVGDVIEGCFKVINIALEKGTKRFTAGTEKKLFQAIIDEAKSGRYDGWDMWRVQLMDCCILLSHHDGVRKQLEDYLDAYIDRYSKGDRYDQSMVSDFKKLQLALMEHDDDTEKTMEFILENIDQPDFREKAIEHHLQDGHNEHVIALCDEGIENDSQHPGLVSRWKKYKLQAYENLGDLSQQKVLTKDLLYLERDFMYYQNLKALYSESEWPDVISEVLNELKLTNIYTQILVEENMLKPLLEYCQDWPESIGYYYHQLIDDYPEEVDQLFQAKIYNMSLESGSRKHYRKICREIKIYMQNFGVDKAGSIIDDLMVKYNQRPAFLDELNKIKLG